MNEPKLELPPAPETESGAVKAWSEPVRMMTYAAGEPDRNPLFLEKRVYQGSNGKVYPLPVIDHVATTPEERVWQAIHIENEHVRLMVMSELGGRIHVGLDKRTGYDFFYRQNVIKPALVGLAGPWISGGVEFNWPQHHRPATYMPVETAIERGDDGSVTVWCSDHDPMARMKGMHGICLRPGVALVEVKVRLYNRTMDTQTFLWWANVATRVHEQYQSFFPHDVRFAADHAKRAVTTYPLSDGVYYGVNYGERGRAGVPAAEKPREFVPDGSYAANDLGWYANIPVPTSYMIVGSRGDFFGGYDHRAQAGTVAVSNHHIAPGKKQWTWGNQEFGYAWDRNLTESDGPYVELMSGAYTDNQPDFSFLAPGETKTFSQYWYPIGASGVPDLANLNAALRVGTDAVYVQATRGFPACELIVEQYGAVLARWSGSLEVGEPLALTFAKAGNAAVTVTLRSAGDVVLRYAPAEIVPVESPTVATEPPLPADVASNDELYLNGLHLEQYRHPTRAPEPYWQEALRRDPGDSRCNAALGRWHMRRGEFAAAESLLSAAITRITVRNPNPYDGEPFYNLGLCRLYLGKRDAAYEAFYKSTWNAAWRGPGYLRLAEIDCVRGEWELALDHLDRSLRAESESLLTRGFKALVLRRLGRDREATTLLEETLRFDPLDVFARYVLRGDIPCDGQTRLDLAFDLKRAGFLKEAWEVVRECDSSVNDGSTAPRRYLEADILKQMGHESGESYRRAAAASTDYVFPHRLEEIALLERAMEATPEDGNAAYFLGNLVYDRRRHREAIRMWERAAAANPQFAIVWRNLGFAYQNIEGDAAKAKAAFAKARMFAPGDARVLYEQDQLLKRTGTPLAERLAQLEANRDLVARRDDLSLELAQLLNSVGRAEDALALLRSRKFQPWEGGEGLVLGEYVRANVLLAQEALEAGDASGAIAFLDAAVQPPENLSEAQHPLVNTSMVDTVYGFAYAMAGDAERAAQHWKRAAARHGDFQQMQVRTVSEMTYWSALALRALGLAEEASAKFAAIVAYAQELDQQTPQIDYFATSLPTLLLFDEDLKERQTITARFLEAQGRAGLGELAAAQRLLDEVLERDRSHAGAIDLRKALAEERCTAR